jgi:Fe-S-cluster containining protein
MFNLAQFVPSHVCLACDGCCRFKEEDSSWRPKVGADEGLAEHIFAREALDAGQRIKTVRCQDGAYQCRFFSPEGNVCTIYAYRPFECRLYPFILRQVGSEVVLAVHLNCPHIQQTKKEESFDQYVQYLRIFFAEYEVAEFLRNNRSLVDPYSSYDDELENLFTIYL